MRQLLKMWRDQFGYVPLTLAEAEALEGRIVSPDTDSAQLLKKDLRPRCGVSLPIPTCFRVKRCGTEWRCASVLECQVCGRCHRVVSCVHGGRLGPAVIQYDMVAGLGSHRKLPPERECCGPEGARQLMLDSPFSHRLFRCSPSPHQPPPSRTVQVGGRALWAQQPLQQPLGPRLRRRRPLPRSTLAQRSSSQYRH